MGSSTVRKRDSATAARDLQGLHPVILGNEKIKQNSPEMSSPAYIELHARSAFSFLRGASIPEDYIEQTAAHNSPAMALTDVDGVYGSPRFHMSAKKAGINAHIGAEITTSH